MTDTWANTRASINRLKKGLGEADEDTRWDFGFWAAGLGMMGMAIIIQFGGAGLLFCFGLVIWAAANKSINRT